MKKGEKMPKIIAVFLAPMFALDVTSRQTKLDLTHSALKKNKVPADYVSVNWVTLGAIVKSKSVPGIVIMTNGNWQRENTATRMPIMSCR